jgi:hypothetical protein
VSRKAVVTLRHGAGHPSRILLPRLIDPPPSRE